MKSLFTIRTLFLFIIFILAGNILVGQTPFEQLAIDPDHTSVSGITCFDYDQDNDIDIVACHLQTNEVVLWENDGNIPAGWTKKVVQEMTEPLYIVSEDIDNDGLQDLIISGNTNSVFCLINVNGENQWETFVLDDDFNNPHGVFVSDINNDGLKDIVACAREDNTIAWWENNGNDPDTWQKHIVTDQIIGTQTICVADINNDGFKDIIGGSSLSNKVIVFYNNGDSLTTFTQQFANESLELPHWVSVADIDNDGNLDILVAACVSREVAWLHNDGGNPITWTQKTIGSNFRCALTVEAADIDMDGDLDVAATAWGSNRIAWWEQKQTNNQISWTRHYLSTNYKGPWPLVFSDIDKDTDMDIVTGADLNGLGNESPLSLWENKTVTTNVISLNANSLNKFTISPQPANKNVQISYTLLEDSFVTVSIYNTLGNEIETLFIGNQLKGNHKTNYDLSSLNNKIVPSLYFCKLVINNKTFIKKIIIVNQ